MHANTLPSFENFSKTSLSSHKGFGNFLFSLFQSRHTFGERHLFAFLQRFHTPIEHKTKKDQELIRTLLTTVLSKTPPYFPAVQLKVRPTRYLFVFFLFIFLIWSHAFFVGFRTPHAFFFLPYHCLNVFVSVGTNSTE
jgi:hypothetical protein